MRQLLRVAMAQHIFREVPGRPGTIVHTPASRMLVEDDLLYQWVAWYTGMLSQNSFFSPPSPPSHPLNSFFVWLQLPNRKETRYTSIQKYT